MSTRPGSWPDPQNLPRARHLPIWYGDIWECLCGWDGESDSQAWGHSYAGMKVEENPREIPTYVQDEEMGAVS